MLKVLATLTLFGSLLISQTLSSTLTQRGGEHNALFLNPTYLSYKPQKDTIEADIINTSLIIDNQSLDFIKALNQVDNNRDISKLLKENIGETLTLSANNFSSIYQAKENIAWSIGIANSLDGYFITHSGFGSKRAMETSIEKNQALIGTAVLKQENLYYGLNLKLIKKSQTVYNYAINEMATQDSLWDYFDNSHTKKESAIGVDFGITYALPLESFKSKLSFAILDIGNSSFKELKAEKQSTTLGLSIEPKDSHIKIDYFNNHLRADISKNFFNKKLELHSGIIYNALSLGINYKFSIFNIGLFTYKVKEYNSKKERKSELSLAVLW